MKKLVILFSILMIFILSTFVFSKKSFAADVCLDISGAFNATYWPNNDHQIRVWCDGDGGPYCNGDSEMLLPGAPFDLSGCSCEPYASGCLNISGIPPECGEPEIVGPRCGVNGQSLQTNINVYCPQACVPTERQYSQCGGNCNGTNFDGNHKLDITERTACDGTKSWECTYVTECPNGCDANIGQCKAAPPPPVSSNPPPSTPPVACNQDCSSNPQICSQATDGCIVCGSNGTCQLPPSAVPIPPSSAPVPSSIPGPSSTPGGPITIPLPSATPQATIPGSSVAPLATSTPRPPTATPIPDFNTAMCKCDGVESGLIIPGQDVQFTAFGKVEGADTSKAQIKDITFFAAEDSTVIGKSLPIGTSIVQNSSSLVRYRASWTYKIPQTLKKGAIYRIWAQLNCQRKTTAQITSPSTVVLAAQTERPGLLQRISDFFSRLFGRQAPEASPTPTPTQAPVSTDASTNLSQSAEDTVNTPTPRGRDNLQLQTFYPAKVLQKSCSFIMFQSQ